MSLDVGDVRIGIAVSDLMGVIANPLETYTRKGNLEVDAKYIVDLAKSKEVSLFISGLPLGLNGQENEQTTKTRLFIDELTRQCDIPVKYRDGDLGGYARARVQTLSNDSHLYRDGLPTNHASTRLRAKY